MPNVNRCCPRCGVAAVLEERERGGRRYLGCPRERCDYTEPLPIDQELREADATPLPGLD